jgi:hypothetical protein
MGLGYSAANNTNPALFPSIFYTGRNAGSPLGTMPLGEASIFTGTSAAAPSGSRWGDYTAMDVDPVDDTTFWYVNEYYPAATTTWRLRVGSFKLIPSAFPAAATATLTSESCSPPNNTPDPGETIGISLCVTNNGDLATTNTVGTLQATGGVTNPSAAQSYGAIAPGATVCRTFTFVASGTCGGTVTPTLQLQDGSTNFGNASFGNFTLGTTSTTTIEDFDGVTAPTLPAGWTTTFSGSGTAATTSTTFSDTAPNNVFLSEAATVGLSEVTSPSIAVPAGGGTRLSFRNLYNTEATYDGLVLEISINGGAFQDIIAAGGTFVSGGYTGPLNTGFSNPLPGRQAWSGLSGGTAAAPAYITSVVNLPPAAAGQMIQLKWRQGSDSSVAPATNPGSRIDTIRFVTPLCSTNCSTAPTPTAAASRKTHTGVGTFDVPLPLTGGVGIESRRGSNGTNDHTIVLTFGTSVSVGGSPQAQVISGSGTVGSNGASNGGSVTVSGSTISIPLTNVANAQTISVRVNGVNTGSGAGDVVIPMGVLLGDTNGDRAVNSGDALQTRSRSGQTADGTNFRSDVNTDGAIGAGDTILVRGQAGNTLP